MMVIKILRTNYKARYCSSREKVEGASFCVFSYELKINFRKNCNMAFQESLWNVFQETEWRELWNCGMKVIPEVTYSNQCTTLQSGGGTRSIFAPTKSVPFSWKTAPKNPEFFWLKQYFFFTYTGVIYDLSQSYQIAFYVAGACSTVGTCLLFLVPVLMPPELCNNNRGRAETVCSKDCEKPLIRIQSPDSSNPTTSTKASLGSCQKLNSTLHLAPSQSYLNRYWDIPKRTSMRASMASLLSFGPVQPARSEVLVVVERVSQV